MFDSIGFLHSVHAVLRPRSKNKHIYCQPGLEWIQILIIAHIVSLFQGGDRIYRVGRTVVPMQMQFILWAET